MSLEIFTRTDRIGDFEVIDMDRLREEFPEKFDESGAMNWDWFEKDIRPNHFIYVRQDKQSISFTLQNGPIKEVGLNGCQVDTIIEAAKIILASFNFKHPCRENSIAITKLEEALMWLDKRKKDRIERGVEGENKT
jgi:hypothetical protein